jgi:hypothetical protein
MYAEVNEAQHINCGAPDVGKDENVFDIQQGVSINIFVKKRKTA